MIIENIKKSGVPNATTLLAAVIAALTKDVITTTGLTEIIPGIKNVIDTLITALAAVMIPIRPFQKTFSSL